MHSIPSYRVSTVGYFETSPLNLMVAPEFRWKSTLDRSRMAPDTYVPDGTTTWPPPAALAALMAAANAAELSVFPSAFAPNEVTLNCLVCGLIAASTVLTMSCAACQGRSVTATAWGVTAAGALVPASAWRAITGTTIAAPVTAAPRPIACRRDNLSAMFFPLLVA